LFVATDLATGVPGPVDTVRRTNSLPPIGEAEERAPIAEERREVRAKGKVPIIS